MASTMSFALVGALICSLTLLPVLCAFFLRKHVHEPRIASTKGFVAFTGACWLEPAPPRGHGPAVLAVFGASLLLIPPSARIHAAPDEGALWIRATTPTPSPSTRPPGFPADSQYPAEFSPGHRSGQRAGRPDDGTDPTGFFNNEFYIGLKPTATRLQGAIRTKPQLIEAMDSRLTAFPGVVFNHTQPPKTPWTRRDRPQELSRVEDLRSRFESA